MCGIYGYIGDKNATEMVFKGLKKLDYRGYDSWGIGIRNKGLLRCDKDVGEITNSKVDLPDSLIAIGHTRWATHGLVNKVNAHPHIATDKSFMLAHNGIVENYENLKIRLQQKQYKFKTQTDTEVIVGLIEDKLKTSNGLADAARKAFKVLKGRNTVIILSREGMIISLRNGSPLVMGINDGYKEIYLSSDTLSFADLVEKILVVENGQMVVCEPGKIEMKSIVSGRGVKPVWEKNKIRGVKTTRLGYEHYMLKEINESPEVIDIVRRQDKKLLEELVKVVKKSRNVYIIGSGTAGIAAAQTAYYLKLFAGISAISLIGAESREYFDMFGKDDLMISLSQSGETADVLEVLEIAKERRVKIASFVNMVGSMMTRMSDYKFMSNAGPEICVMSTKIFVSQLSWGYLLAKTAQDKYSQGTKSLRILSEKMSEFLQNKEKTKKLRSFAKKLSKTESLYLLGRSQNLQIVKEGMVKIIESSYIHAHALPAGDLKHYAITLMEDNVPVLAVISNDFVKADSLSGINEAKARGVTIFGLSPEPHEKFDYYLKLPDAKETAAIMNIIPLQLLAYYMGVALGNNIDKPRNIAKSVTVK